MSSQHPLRYHVYDDLNSLRARTKWKEDALHFVAHLLDGAHIVLYRRNKPTVRLWVKGAEEKMSLCDTLRLMCKREREG